MGGLSRIVFLDRDGTLIADKHHLCDPAGVELLPGAAEAVRRLREAGCRLHLFTNQSGVGRGWFTLADVEAVNRRMLELMGLEPNIFEGVCIATERPDEPVIYRKPSGRYIREVLAAQGVRAAEACMVGDTLADVGAALDAGVRAILLDTGKTKDPRLVPEVVSGKAEVFGSLLEWVRSER